MERHGEDLESHSVGKETEGAGQLDNTSITCYSIASRGEQSSGS